MFPSGRPGAALLILRVSLGVLLVDGLIGPLLRLGSPWALAVPIGIALALISGALTPVFATLAILVEVVTLAISPTDLHAIHVCAVLDAVAIALLGPGSYSVDARLFGRRQIVFPHDRTRERD